MVRRDYQLKYGLKRCIELLKDDIEFKEGYTDTTLEESVLFHLLCYQSDRDRLEKEVQHGKKTIKK